MIDVQTLFLNVNNDLAIKGKGGYASNEEYNRSLRLAQLDIFEIMCRSLEIRGEISESLQPFLREVFLAQATTTGNVLLPDDYGRKLEVGCRRSVSVPGGEPKVSFLPCEHLGHAEVYETLVSSVRKPDAEKGLFYYSTPLPGMIRLYPNGLGDCYLKYLALPPVATRAVTLDIVNDQENYNAGDSTQLQWHEKDLPLFVEILCFYKGVQVKSPELVQFFQQKPNLLQ